MMLKSNYFHLHPVLYFSYFSTFCFFLILFHIFSFHSFPFWTLEHRTYKMDGKSILKNIVKGGRGIIVLIPSYHISISQISPLLSTLSSSSSLQFLQSLVSNIYHGIFKHVAELFFKTRRGTIFERVAEIF